MEENQPDNLSRNVNATKGSDLWSQTFFKETVLTALLHDIGRLEQTGISDHQHCVFIHRALEKYVDSTTNVPNVGVFAGKPLYEHIQRFTNIYFDWNEIKGTGESAQAERRSMHRALRKARQSIADKERKLRFEIENNYDVAHLKAGYQSMQDVITLVPDTFKYLGQAIQEYIKKGGTLK